MKGFSMDTTAVEKILIDKFFHDSMYALSKALLVMRKTPNEIDIIYNKIRDLVGADSQNKSIFDGLSLNGSPIDLSKPLDDNLYRALLFELSREVINEEFSSSKDFKNS